MTPPERPLTDRDYRALARFRRGLRGFLAFSEAAARAEGITPAQHQLLLAIRGHPNDTAPSVSDLAVALGRKRHSTVELVGRAVANDLVDTAVDPDDRRRRLVTLTPTGRRLVERLSTLHRRELHDMRGDLAHILDELA